jgi:YVTN family beta-propeller protein
MTGGQPPERFLATVLFTDIVGSTELAAELGDRAWRELLELHHALVRQKLQQYRGREIDTAGDGFFASFDAPAVGVRCALDIVRSAPEHGVRVRSGLHIGEVEQVGGRRGKIGGIAVHIGARVAGTAEAGEVLVTAGVRDLSAGAGLQFEDRGTRQLKGVPGEWHIYAAAQEAAGLAPISDEERSLRRAAAIRRVRARPFWQRHPRWSAATAVGLVLLLAIGGLMVWRPWRPIAVAGVAEDSVGLIDIGRGELIAEIPVGRRPSGVVIGEDAAWVANTTDDSVSRIDLSTRAVIDTIQVGRLPAGIAIGFGSVWVANSGARTVSRIDMTTDEVVDEVDVGNGPNAIADGTDAVWVANAADGTVARIDPGTGEVLTIAVGPTPLAVAADADAIWVAHHAGGGALTRIDPASKSVVAFVPLGSAPSGLAVGGGSVWVTSSANGTVARIDPAGNRVVDVITTGPGASGISAADSGIWVANALDGSITVIDPDSGSSRQIPVGSAPEGVAAHSDVAWFTARPASASHRGGTLRVVAPDPPDSLDPALAVGFSGSWNILGVTNDGLVAFKRTPGRQSAELIPDLAVSIPRPSDGGTTYTFQLRPGIEFSNGDVVRPEDVRASIERVYEVPWDLFEPGQASPGTVHYTNIVGGQACADAAPAPCDLSDGIIADNDTDTVTFRLASPDPFFLDRLALPYASVLPASTPTEDLADPTAPVPATGPYMVAEDQPPVTRTLPDQSVEVVEEGSVKLVRNPRFETWSPDARPDGYADEIVISTGYSASEEVAMVEAGEADWMIDRVPSEEIHRLQTSYPAQLHPSLGSVTWAFMNTEMAPLDNPNVRRAINFAVDRAHVQELYGGPAEGAITCQLVPPAIPGYEPYCPYTIDPNPAGEWRGPDLVAARELVEASGTAGMAIAVATNPRHAESGAYLASVLDDLGYEASSNVVDEYFPAVFVERSVQIGIFEFVPDMAATAAGWLQEPAGCAGAFNPAVFCDAQVDEAIAQALDIQQEDAPAAWKSWAAIDRQITDAAPFIPLLNPVTYDFVSERLGNYQSGVLLEQLWVQ